MQSNNSLLTQDPKQTPMAKTLPNNQLNETTSATAKILATNEQQKKASLKQIQKQHLDGINCRRSSTNTGMAIKSKMVIEPVISLLSSDEEDSDKPHN